MRRHRIEFKEVLPVSPLGCLKEIFKLAKTVTHTIPLRV